jgi:DNA-directed RNA polymerase specialized sigma24 family protein
MRSAPLDEGAEARHRRDPQWTMPCLAAFADQTHGARSIGPDIEIADRRRGGLAGAGAGVVEEQQEAVIAPAVLDGTVRHRQQRVHLRFVEIAETGAVVSFEGHRPNLAAPGNQLWTSLADEGGQGGGGATANRGRGSRSSRRTPPRVSSAREITSEPTMARGGRRFETTRWSLVLAADASQSSAAREALATLFETYWYPLYSYVRRHGHGADDAQDVVQSFIVALLERDDLRGLRPERGRFRAFLIVALRHFLAHRRIHDRALKRGGGQAPLSLDVGAAERQYCREPAAAGTPETAFDRNWALALLQEVFRGLRTEWEAKDRAAEFDRLKDCLVGELPPGGYRALAVDLGSTEAATKMAVHRLKRRFQQALLREVRDTVTEDAVDDELRYLLKALRG